MNQISKSGNLPNLIIIGAMKSGTSSLHRYLNLHPEIVMSRQKELNFFIEEENWRKGIQWYKSHFVGQAKVYGESSPNYTKQHIFKNVPERIFSVIPETKIIYLVRDPIERITSHYIHAYSNGTENRSIEEALSQIEGNHYVESSRYFFQIEQYLKFFSNSNILVICSEKLLKSPQETMEKVFQFLKIDNTFEFKFDSKSIGKISEFGLAITSSNFQFNKKLHESTEKRRMKISKNSLITKSIDKITNPLPSTLKYHFKNIIYFPFSEKIERPKINQELRQKIIDYLSEDVDKLKKYTGYSLKKWNFE